MLSFCLSDRFLLASWNFLLTCSLTPTLTISSEGLWNPGADFAAWAELSCFNFGSTGKSACSHNFSSEFSLVNVEVMHVQCNSKAGMKQMDISYTLLSWKVRGMLFISCLIFFFKKKLFQIFQRGKERRDVVKLRSMSRFLPCLGACQGTGVALGPLSPICFLMLRCNIPLFIISKSELQDQLD